MFERRRSLSSTKFIRSFNAVSILRTLYRKGSCSRVQLTETTQMSPSTVTRIISKLLEQEMITRIGIGESIGGRKPEIFQLNYEKLYLVGVRMLRNQVDLAVADLKGKILRKREFQPYSLEPEALITEVAREFELLLKDSSIQKDHILGLGLAIAGIVDNENGILLRSVNLGWREVKIQDMLEKTLGVPVLLENDANAAALAEFWFGCGKDVANLLYLKTDTGVGAGIIHERNLFTGFRGMAGEIGHIPFMRQGHKCRCGLQGCLETYLYFFDVMRRYEAKTGLQLEDIDRLFRRALDGDNAAWDIVNEAADALAIAVSFANGLLDLDMVVIGGVWGSLGEEFLDMIRHKYRVIPEKSGLNREVFITHFSLGADCDLLGAVGLVINRWLASPI